MKWVRYVWQCFRHDWALTAVTMQEHLDARCPRCLWLYERFGR